jgi:SsrA-binding protein
VNHEPRRARKLLLQTREIRRLIGSVEQKGLTLIPLDVHLARGRAKVTLALARGKKEHDKRETLKRRIADREAARAMGRRR